MYSKYFSIFQGSKVTLFRHFSTEQYFAVLGLKPNVTLAEIKKKYYQLAIKRHPDHGGKHEEFLKIKAAYEALIQTVHIPLSEKPGKTTYKKGKKSKKSATIESLEDLEEFLTELGRDKLFSFLSRSYDLASLILRVAEDDRKKLIDLIGREHIAKVLELHDLFNINLTAGFHLSWDNYLNLFNIFGRDTVLNCLKADYYRYGSIFSAIGFWFETDRCDDFVDYLGAGVLGLDHMVLNEILLNITENKQKELLSQLGSNYFKSQYIWIHPVTGTLKVLHPSNHELFLNSIGKNEIDSFLKQKITQSHKEDFYKIVKNYVTQVSNIEVSEVSNVDLGFRA